MQEGGKIGYMAASSEWRDGEGKKEEERDSVCVWGGRYQCGHCPLSILLDPKHVGLYAASFIPFLGTRRCLILPLPCALMPASLAGASAKQSKPSGIILGEANARTGFYSLACAFPEGWFLVPHSLSYGMGP